MNPNACLVAAFIVLILIALCGVIKLGRITEPRAHWYYDSPEEARVLSLLEKANADLDEARARIITLDEANAYLASEVERLNERR